MSLMGKSIVLGVLLFLFVPLALFADIYSNMEVEMLIRAQFPDASQMVEVARCESRLQQLDTSESVLRGGAGNAMIGLFQINGPVHQDFARSLGMDIEMLEGNLAYAKYLYDSEGTDPWNSSRSCWQHAESSSVVSTAANGVFSRDLEVGFEGEDVRELQTFLNSAGFTLAASGPGSPGNETMMFGALTRAALARYQQANGISPAVGYFGPITRRRVALASPAESEEVEIARLKGLIAELTAQLALLRAAR